MRTFDVIHMRSSSFYEANGTTPKESQAEREAGSRVVGRIEAEKVSQANRLAREMYPAPEGYFTTIHEAR